MNIIIKYQNIQEIFWSNILSSLKAIEKFVWKLFCLESTWVGFNCNFTNAVFLKQPVLMNAIYLYVQHKRNVNKSYCLFK